MLLNHLKQRKRSFSRDLPPTVLNRTQPYPDQNRHSTNHTPIRRTLRQDTLENVTEVDSTINGFTHPTEAHEDMSCMVVGQKIRHSPPRPETHHQKHKNNKNLDRRRYSARPPSQQSQGIRTPVKEKKEVKPVLGLPLDVTAVFDYRFSPFHDETAINYTQNRTLSAEVPRTKHSGPSAPSAPSEDDRRTEEDTGLRKMREKQILNAQASAAAIEAGISKLNRPSYMPSQDNLLDIQQAVEDIPERPATQAANRIQLRRLNDSSASSEIDEFDLSPNSKESPQKTENAFDSSIDIPKEGSLLKYFRVQAAVRPKSSANYRQVIEAKKAMYENMSTEEQENSNSPVKGKRYSAAMTSYMATRTDWSRKGARGRRTISCDNTVVNNTTTMMETTAVADVNNKSIKEPSSVDVFSEKVKKYIEMKKEEPDTGISNMDEESFLRSFLQNEYSMLEKLKAQNEQNPIDLTVTPFTIEEKVRSPTNLAIQKANNAIGVIHRTRKRAFAHHRVASDSSRVNKEPDENTAVKNMDELVVYVKSRNKFVEESIKKVEEDRDRKKWNGRLIDTVLDKIKAQGGVRQTVVRSSYGNAMKFERDIEEIKEVRNDIGDVKREMKLIQITKDELYNEKRQGLDKAKFVSPNRLTNTELEFVRDQFLYKKSEEMNMDKIDDLLKRLKFFAQLSRGVRISFYNCAKYIKEQRGHYIFHQGDIGDLMYIILRGSVNVKVPKRLKDGSCQFITVASLYDGSHFGELAIMAVKQKPRVRDEEEEKEKEKAKQRSKIKENLNLRTKKPLETKSPKPEVKETSAEPKPAGDGGAPILAQQKRSASIQCAEETEMLTMSRDKFQEILLLVMNTDMDTKIRLLQLTNFYRRESNFTLMPVANNMKALRYKLGQKVIQKGDILMNFYIIAKGTCKVVQEIEEEYDYDAGIYEGKLKPFIYKDFTDIDGKEEEGARHQNNDNSKWTYPPNPMLRTFDYGLPETKEDEKKNSASKSKEKGKRKGQKFIKHVIYKEMSVGEFFGFRPLLRPESDAKYKQLKESQAKLSVVAYSTDVEIFALPRASLLYLPERVKSMLLDGISKLKDFDNVDINKPIQEQKAWRESQLKLVEDTLMRPEHANLRRPRDNYKAR